MGTDVTKSMTKKMGVRGGQRKWELDEDRAEGGRGSDSIKRQGRRRVTSRKAEK